MKLLIFVCGYAQIITNPTIRSNRYFPQSERSLSSLLSEASLSPSPSSELVVRGGAAGAVIVGIARGGAAALESSVISTSRTSMRLAILARSKSSALFFSSIRSRRSCRSFLIDSPFATAAWIRAVPALNWWMAFYLHFGLFQWGHS